MPIETKGFKKGDEVYHIAGGSGILTGHFENDWKTDPPTVLAQVQITDTIFDPMRVVSIDDLLLAGSN